MAGAAAAAGRENEHETPTRDVEPRTWADAGRQEAVAGESLARVDGDEINAGNKIMDVVRLAQLTEPRPQLWQAERTLIE